MNTKKNEAQNNEEQVVRFYETEITPQQKAQRAWGHHERKIQKIEREIALEAMSLKAHWSKFNTGD